MVIFFKDILQIATAIFKELEGGGKGHPNHT